MGTPTLSLAASLLILVLLSSGKTQEYDCEVDQFRCNDGRCIEEFRRCDSISDCVGGEDEHSCHQGCRSDEFMCAIDRNCIDRTKKCDGHLDCADYSDEDDCKVICFGGVLFCNCGLCVHPWQPCCCLPSSRKSSGWRCATGLICGPGLFRCRNGSCIPDSHRCDSQYDCPDGSDEHSCGIPCPNDDFRCDNGVCIELHRQCDGISHCNDHSDERNCLGPCLSYEFKCGDGRCIPNYFLCNGHRDCDDNSDEDNCGPQPTCRSDQFSCDDGTCLSISQRCNDITECPGGEDEHSCARCKDTEFRCKDGRCIDLTKHCDGLDDCGQNEDEEGCDAPRCQPDEFVCDIRTCMKKSKKCDRIFDCADKTDEDNCDICSLGEFRCLDGTCLNADKRCDGHVDCRDGSDELECDTTCRESEFRCDDGTCISNSLYCNGHPECRDGSDEKLCVEKCSEGQFHCQDGQCIAESFRCDNFNDCLDGSDEINCTCGANEFLCQDQRTCVQEEKKCDRIRDCPDGSDEINCRYPERCASNEFICPDQRTCVPQHKKCDRIPDCPDGWDESSCAGRCTSSEFLCRDRITCVHNSKRCDRVRDCPDGYDEQECHPEPCASSDFTCRDGSCIDSRRRCDRRTDCKDGSDEEGCDCRHNEFRCGSGECIPQYLLCNNRYDCTDGSDEQHCQPTTPAPVRCGPRQYLCRSDGRCLPQSTLCDGKVDCPDYSDESNCAETSGLNLKTYPSDQIIKENREVVFQCRDEGPARARVKWSRADGLQLPPGSRDTQGRLEMPNIQLSHSGTYICEAVGYPENTPGSRVSVFLKVEPFEHPPTRPPLACGLNEATCSNGDCVRKDKVCDGRIDCSDGSDEMRCNPHGCEPNEFRCDNKKCVLKNWRCDSEDDCGDGSDERGCVAIPGSPCKYNEHLCRTGGQCIPKSFHCDGETDCLDGSDEVGCSTAIIVTPPPPMLMVPEGDTYTITCKAVGVPTPEIVWRLNWGHVPEKCTSTSVDGFGTLSCPNAEERDQGAYSCEAVMVRGGSVFAVPDTILVVKTVPTTCSVAHFNALPPPRRECIACFCFGVASECSSANLYVHQLPPPINVYTLIGVQVDPSGRSTIVQNLPSLLGLPEIRPISTNGFTVYHSEPNERTILENNVIPYFSMPESYHGNLLKSYGGHLKYTVRSEGRGRYLDAPDVILSGNGYILVHPGARIVQERNNDVTVRFFFGEWYKNGYTRRGSDSGRIVGDLASREEIMMTLANIDYLLIRAMYDDGNLLETTISNIKMDTADATNIGLGAATYVEECRCPAGYHGLSCERCAPGYHRVKTGPWLGNCIYEETCQPGYYGDPGRGIPCQICPCPLTSPSNQFGRTCILDSDGLPTCNCPQGYRGRRCEYCEDGYEGNPTVPGSSCARIEEHCNPHGSLSRYPDPTTGQCLCKENVYGALCDKCKADAFYLDRENPFGCLLCFCMGITNQCQSSSWYRQKHVLSFASSTMDVKLVRKGQGPITQNITDGIRINPSTREVIFSDFPRGEPAGEFYYWSLPEQFLGDKVTSYGGYLTFTLRYVPAPGGQSSRNSAAVVEIISRNNLHLLWYRGERDPVVPDKQETINVPLNEHSWQRLDAKPVDRPNFLMALADIQYILIKATYTTSTREAALHHVSMDYSVPENTGLERALAVEHCACPRGYEGLSCEDCAPGYTRDDSGIYLGRCQPCQCNGHSEDCDRDTGVCRNCRDNTAGDRCQLCRPGYSGDATNRNIGCTSSGATCNCDSRGSLTAECVNNQCVCKPNVYGRHCDECRPGSFGLSQSLPSGCHECFCSGVSNQCYASSEHYRIQIPMQIGTPGYDFTLTDSTRRETVISEGFILDASRNEIGYAFPPVGITGRNSRLFWSLPSAFTGNKVLSYGGRLSITQRYTARAGSQEYSDTDVIISGNGITLYWKNPTPLTPNQPHTYVVPLVEHEWRHLDRNTPRPASRSDFMTVLINLEAILVRASYSTVTEYSYLSDVAMDTADVRQFSSGSLAVDIEKCLCPEGYTGTSCETCARGYYLDFNDRSVGVFGTCKRCPCNGNEESCELVRERNDYVVRCRCKAGYDESKQCSVETIETTDKPQVRPRPPTISISISEPTIQIVEAGGSVRYRCSGRSLKTQIPVRISWSKEGGPLPPGRSEDDGQGLLIITNVQPADSGTYLCAVTDGESIVTERAVLNVGAPPRAPSLTIHPSDHQEVTEGSFIEFRCEGTGTPLPTLQWSKERGGPLNPTAVFRDGIFRISSVRKSDEAVYVCTGTNPSGTSSERVMLYVRDGAAPRPTQPIQIEPQYFEGNAGETVRLSCFAEHDRRASVRWSREGADLPASATLTDGGTTLTIYSPTASESGVYICTTVTPSGSTVQAQARVTIRAFRSPPTVHIEPDRQTIPQGTSAELRCIAAGDPTPSIRWSKAGEEFSSNVQIIGQLLRLNNAQVTDRGVYICLAENAGGTSQASAIVEVERRQAPSVELYPDQRITVHKGGDALVQCRITDGIPSPKLTWTRVDGRPFSPNVEEPQIGVLRFNQVSGTESGQYLCRAENDAGSASAIATLEIQSQPQITLKYPGSESDGGRRQYHVKTGQRVRMECSADGDPAPSVSWNRHHPGSPRYGYGAETKESAVYEITRVSPSDAGTYSCEARNAVGTTQERLQLIVDTAAIDGENTINNRPPARPYPTETGVRLNNEKFTVLEGGSVTMRCSVEDNRETIFLTWIRGNQQQMPSEHRIQDGTLYINNVRPDAAGEYICQGIGQSGNILFTASSHLEVIAPPRIKLNPTRQVVRPGDHANISCTATGDQPISLSWLRQDGAMPRSVVISGGYLQFRGIELSDAGRYRCTARNPAGEADAVADVIIDEQQQVIRAEQRDVSTYVGSSVELHCTAQPGTRVHWTRDHNQPLPLNVRQREDRQTGQNILELFRVSVEDGGIYFCHSESPHGRSSDYVDLRIDRVNDISLHIDASPDVIRVGDTVDIRCGVSGDPSASVSWSKVGEQLASNIQTRGNLLRVNNVSPANGGIYTCTAITKAGLYKEDYVLTIQGSFSHSAVDGSHVTTPSPIPVETRSVPYGSAVVMECRTDLEHPIIYSWSRQGGLLPKDAIVDMDTLTIPIVQPSDAGIYICTARNNAEKMDIPTVLVVKDVVPRFDQNPISFMSLPTLPSAYLVFSVEISFKPESPDGLILYNGQQPGGSGDFVSFGLSGGYPEFRFDVGSGPAIIRSPEPIALNQWHTVKLDRNRREGSMYVNGAGPYSGEAAGRFQGLDLEEPLYIGGVPDFSTIHRLAGFSQGFIGCISKLVVGSKEHELIRDATSSEGTRSCDTCATEHGLHCRNNGICQEASTPSGFVCICPSGFSGDHCERVGEACFPGACNSGRCVNNEGGFVCLCPIGRKGTRCEEELIVRKPAFAADGGYVAYPTPKALKRLKLTLRFKPNELKNGILLYCAQSEDGKGDFASLTIYDRHVEFRFDVGSGTAIIRSLKELRAGEWATVVAGRDGREGFLSVDGEEMLSGKSPGITRGLNLKTPLYVGGYNQEKIKLAPTVGLLEDRKGNVATFDGCISMIEASGLDLDLVHSVVDSANVGECMEDSGVTDYHDLGGRIGDVDEVNGIDHGNDIFLSSKERNPCDAHPCLNGAFCLPAVHNASDFECHCAVGFRGRYCESTDTICDSHRPCQNGGTCISSSPSSYHCLCSLGYGGKNCDQRVEFGESVGFQGDGYLELSTTLLPHKSSNDLESIIMEFSTTSLDGLIFWHGQTPEMDGRGQDFLAVAVVNGHLEFSYELGSGPASIRLDQTRVDDGKRHRVVFHREGKDGSIELDGTDIKIGKSPGFLTMLNTLGNIYLGGLPKTDYMTAGKYREGFSGCIHSIEIQDSGPINLYEKALSAVNAHPCSNDELDEELHRAL